LRPFHRHDGRTSLARFKRKCAVKLGGVDLVVAGVVLVADNRPELTSRQIVDFDWPDTLRDDALRIVMRGAHKEDKAA
jgi:hypothetical protein